MKSEVQRTQRNMYCYVSDRKDVDWLKRCLLLKGLLLIKRFYTVSIG